MEDNRLIEENRGLVLSIIKKNSPKGLSAEDIEDLEQYGYIGVLEAKQKFDNNKGVKFSTYATPWIKYNVQKGIAQLLGFSRYRNNQIIEMKRAENELAQELNRKPTDNELADKLQIPLEKLSEIKKLIQPKVSLENSIDSESKSTMADVIADDSMNPEEQLIAKEELKIRERIEKAFFRTLTKGEKRVYLLRKKYNITTTAKMLGSTRQRIYTIENDIELKDSSFRQSEEYYNIENGITKNLLKEIINESKKNIDVSAKGEKIAKYENYEDLQEKDFKELSTKFFHDYSESTMYPTFGEFFKKVCEDRGITEAMFCRATKLDGSSFTTYKSSKASPSLVSLIAFGIYFKISTNIIEKLIRLSGCYLKENDKTHMAYSFILENLKGYPIAYCNKVLELFGIEEKDLLQTEKKKRTKKKKTK